MAEEKVVFTSDVSFKTQELVATSAPAPWDAIVECVQIRSTSGPIQPGVLVSLAYMGTGFARPPVDILQLEGMAPTSVANITPQMQPWVDGRIPVVILGKGMPVVARIVNMPPGMNFDLVVQYRKVSLES